MKISPIQLQNPKDSDAEFVPRPGGIYVPVNVLANGTSFILSMSHGLKGNHTRAVFGVHHVPRNFSI